MPKEKAKQNKDVDSRSTKTTITEDEDYNLSETSMILDDGSENTFKIKNREVVHEHIIYKELAVNLGRSAIRNALGKVAKYPYLMFMDCDSKVVRKDFIKKYFLQTYQPN